MHPTTVQNMALSSRCHQVYFAALALTTFRNWAFGIASDEFSVVTAISAIARDRGLLTNKTRNKRVLLRLTWVDYAFDMTIN